MKYNFVLLFFTSPDPKGSCEVLSLGKLACSNTGPGGIPCQHATVVSCCIRGI